MSLRELIKELRKISSCGVIECKKALEEANGDLKFAIEILRKRGIQLVASKADRVTRQGKIESYIHSQGKIGVLVEINCETDFVAKNEEFARFAKDIAMQIAAMSPKYIKREEVPQDVKDKEDAGFYKQVCLLEQLFIKDESLTIGDYLASIIAKTGENIIIRRFTRYQLGE